MHLRGKSFRFEAAYPDRRRKVLLDVPRYEFDWQNVYVLSQPKLMPEGDRAPLPGAIRQLGRHPVNPDPKRTVTWGEQTQDEMLVGYVEVAPAAQDFALGEPEARRRDDGRYDVTSRYLPPAGTASVYLAGTFNGWKPMALKMSGPDPSDRFVTKLILAAGTHEYKYVIDDTRWRQDPGNRRRVGFYHNSVLGLDKAR